MDALDLNAEKFKQDAAYARQWVADYAQLTEKEELPTSLLDVFERSPDVLTEYADFLGDALRDWYSRLIAAVKAKRESPQDQTLRVAAVSASRDFTWLLAFIKKSLVSVSPAQDTKRPPCLRLTQQITKLALTSREPSDIQYAIDILILVVQRFQLPEESLEDALRILCASAMRLQPIPDPLRQSFREIMEGSFSRQAMDVMLEFVAKPTAENKAVGLQVGRGSLRLLQGIVDLRDEHGAWTLDMPKLLTSTQLAASQHILRYTPDLVNTLHVVLAHESRKAQLPELKIAELLSVLQNCLQAESPDQEVSSSSERYTEDRNAGIRAIGNDIEASWRALSMQQKTDVSDYAIQNPRMVSTELLRSCLDFISEGQHLTFQTERWRERTQWILQHIIRDGDLHPDGRLSAIKALSQAMTALGPTPSDEAFKDSVEVVIGDYKKVLLLQLKDEKDKTVLAEISDALIILARRGGCTVYIMTELTQTVIDGLPTKGRGKNALFATRTLVTIFAETFEPSPKLALRAYSGLVKISSLDCPFRAARIAAMRILFSLRSTHDGFVFITDDMSAGYIATALCRTRESAEAFDNGVTNFDRHSTSSSSISNPTGPSYEPTWMFDDEDNLASPRTRPSKHITADKVLSKSNADLTHLDVTAWLLELIRVIQKDDDWEVYSWVMVNLGSQLANVKLFCSSLETIVFLRQVVCAQINDYKMHEPPVASGLKKSDVAMCLFNILTPLIAYATKRGEVIQKEFGDELVKAFLNGVASQHYEGTARGCIHALSICIFEIPSSVASLFPNILERASRSMTQSHLTLHMLEFLSEVASLEELHSNFMQQEVAKMFGMCIQFLERTREQATLSMSNVQPRVATPSRQSGVTLKRPPYRAAMMKDVGVPQYASALAYHTMIRWFLSLRLEVRARLVSWIVPRFIWKSSQGEEMIDEQSEVFIDMMQRTAFSDLGETQPNPSFSKPTDGSISSASWVMGYSIITAETAGHTGLTQITKRQASGTTHAIYQQLTTKVPGHLAPSNTEIQPGAENDGPPTEMLPAHILLQMVSTAAPIPTEDQPITLPHDDFVNRALTSFDRIPTVDSHKAGVIYIGPGQTEEADYLSAGSGSADYDRFVDGLGYKVALEGDLEFNPQGLSHPRDGSTTVAWRDRVTEMVFLIPTMMPPNPNDDPEWLHKKAHVGNCFVNIIFNNSGLPWDFERLRSQLNYINIVITPADTIDEVDAIDTKKSPSMPAFYHVQVLTKPSFPNISPAADLKVISATQLPKFVRVLAINANVFAQCWQTKDTDKEFPSNWRERLAQIKRLKARMAVRIGSGTDNVAGAGTTMSPPPSSGGGGGRRTPAPKDDTGGGGKADGALAKQLDFGRWTF
ncbi:uncharacterized protein AB675_116 [Cyphellophora attinorum]|uniref:Rap-GAP domain-containing protein n=1 Tax=Cyphellophora attinorum TaxID=1664694 RepID=A0A0N1NXJ5_9EURO|nr:uncharacterized protein AB675_116 [Phialophora attinorum]KPI37767.1 hypothetical protein AB675_116 [Phialophora attinorum]